jgi:transketolase
MLAARARGENHALDSRADPAKPSLRPPRFHAGEFVGGGAYELAPADGGPTKVSIFASGSEVSIALDARGILAERGIAARVVWVPCMTLFLRQDRDRRQNIIGDAPVRAGVEAAVRQGWDAIIGEDGIFIGMTGFGASAPYQDVYNYFNITPEAVAEAAMRRCGS